MPLPSAQRQEKKHPQESEELPLTVTHFSSRAKH